MALEVPSRSVAALGVVEWLGCLLISLYGRLPASARVQRTPRRAALLTDSLGFCSSLAFFLLWMGCIHLAIALLTFGDT